MAQVTSGKDMTIIVLDNNEASALADVLEHMVGEHSVLDELTDAFLGTDWREEDEEIEPVTNWDRPEPPWKDEPSSDYRFGRG